MCVLFYCFLLLSELSDISAKLGRRNVHMFSILVNVPRSDLNTRYKKKMCVGNKRQKIFCGIIFVLIPVHGAHINNSSSFV